jgi:DNA processing protein
MSIGILIKFFFFPYYMEKNELKYLIALHSFPKFGPVRLRRLKNYFNNYQSAFQGNINEYLKAGLEENIANEFISQRNNISTEQLLEKLNAENISVVTLDDELYPKLLKEIYDPPVLLYYKGRLSADDEFNIAVVGSRKYSNYGKQIVDDLVFGLAKSEITIVSGLALGIDSMAHQATIDAKGRTIAVLGTGLDRQSIYPSSNRYLHDKIINTGGLVISEFPLGTPPLKHHFPQRNRIISGLSLGVLIIEAGEKSGSLITAHFALEQNREVFAVPGNIFSPVSVGTNNLIKQGAKTVTNASDILEALDLVNITNYINNKKIIPETAEEELIVTHLSQEPLHINDIARLANLNISQVNSLLTIMEMKGMVKNLGNMEYVLPR